MIYRIIVSDDAREDIAALKKSEHIAYNKVQELFNELKENPRTGIGKPELMKYGKLAGLWSRRVSSKHRLVYSINDNEVLVLVLSAKGHYGDK